MKLIVYNLTNVINEVNAHQDGEMNLISIRDRYCSDSTAKKYTMLDQGIAKNNVNVLTMYFDDIDPYRFYHGMEHFSIKEKFADGKLKPVFFSKEHAIEIVDWVRKLWEKDHNVTIHVHCWAGRSRSQAVAYWLNMYFNLILDRNMDDYLINNALNVVEKIHFNCEVLRVFTTTFG